MTELTTSATDSGLSITIFRPVVPRKGSMLAFISVLHHTSLVLYRPLAEHSYAKPRLQLKENTESIRMSGHFVMVFWF